MGGITDSLQQEDLLQLHTDADRTAAVDDPAAAAAELQKLSHEQQRLREGRKVLEAEVQRRADLSFADGFGGGLLNEGCALCKVK